MQNELRLLNIFPRTPYNSWKNISKINAFYITSDSECAVRVIQDSYVGRRRNVTVSIHSQTSPMRWFRERVRRGLGFPSPRGRKMIAFNIRVKLSKAFQSARRWIRRAIIPSLRVITDDKTCAVLSVFLARGRRSRNAHLLVVGICARRVVIDCHGVNWRAKTNGYEIKR